MCLELRTCATIRMFFFLIRGRVICENMDIATRVTESRYIFYATEFGY